MAQDRVSTTDSVVAGLAGYAPPAFPCLACGKETTEHSVAGMRICEAARCRAVFPETAYDTPRWVTVETSQGKRKVEVLGRVRRA